MRWGSTSNLVFNLLVWTWPANCRVRDLTIWHRLLITPPLYSHISVREVWVVGIELSAPCHFQPWSYLILVNFCKYPPKSAWIGNKIAKIGHYRPKFRVLYWKVHWLEKSTLPTVVAVVTNIRYISSMYCTCTTIFQDQNKPHVALCLVYSDNQIC